MGANRIISGWIFLWSVGKSNPSTRVFVLVRGRISDLFSHRFPGLPAAHRCQGEGIGYRYKPYYIRINSVVTGTVTLWFQIYSNETSSWTLRIIVTLSCIFTVILCTNRWPGCWWPCTRTTGDWVPTRWHRNRSPTVRFSPVPKPGGKKKKFSIGKQSGRRRVVPVIEYYRSGNFRRPGAEVDHLFRRHDAGRARDSKQLNDSARLL